MIIVFIINNIRLGLGCVFLFFFKVMSTLFSLKAQVKVVHFKMKIVQAKPKRQRKGVCLKAKCILTVCQHLIDCTHHANTGINSLLMS